VWGWSVKSSLISSPTDQLDHSVNRVQLSIHLFVLLTHTHTLINSHWVTCIPTCSQNTHTYSDTYSSRSSSYLLGSSPTNPHTHTRSVECRPFLLTGAHLASLARGRVHSNFVKNCIFFTFSYISASWRVMHKAGPNTFSFVNLRVFLIIVVCFHISERQQLILTDSSNTGHHTTVFTSSTSKLYFSVLW
jgi:hypothetical protein